MFKIYIHDLNWRQYLMIICM